MCLLSYTLTAFADENFVPGIYQDSTGREYQVSGAAPSQPGRSQWTIISTTFNAVWETGAAVGNIWLPGNTNVLNYPADYASGHSYGITSDNSWVSGFLNWTNGSVISVSQVGTTLVFSLLNANGSVATSQTLSYVRAAGATTVSTTTYHSGVYQDSSGNLYLVSGAAPSQPGREQWTITSTTPKVAGTTNTFNVIWETGAALGNIWLPGNNNVLNYPAGYASGRSYGVLSYINSSFGGSSDNGQIVSVSQIGTTLVISRLKSNGSVISSRTLWYVSAGGATTASTTTYQSGVYEDPSGNRYLVSGAAPSQSGREQWTIISTTPKVAGTTNEVNAMWETGAAAGNIWMPGSNNGLSGSNNVLNYPAGYASGRSYGITSNTNWFGGNGYLISVSQVGTTLVIAGLTNDGTVWTAETLSYVSAGGATTASSTTYQSGVYQDSIGNQYQVTGADPCTTDRAQWTIKSTTPRVAGTTVTFNANWETGAAVGNAYLIGNSNVTASSAGYPIGRSYGTVSSTTSWDYFNSGNVISVSQVGATLVISRLNNNGSVSVSKTLSYIPIAAPSQTISFCVSPTVISIGGTSTIGGTATSGLLVSYSSTTLSVCSVSGTTVTGVAEGTCTIAANQAGNASYGAASQVTRSITVVRSSSDCIFNWAERSLPQYFSPVGVLSATYAPYYYRYYSGTGNFLATSSADNHLWVIGQVTGNSLLDVGPISSFLSIAGCSP